MGEIFMQLESVQWPMVQLNGLGKKKQGLMYNGTLLFWDFVLIGKESEREWNISILSKVIAKKIQNKIN